MATMNRFRQVQILPDTSAFWNDLNTMGYTNGQFFFPGFPGDDKDIPVTLEKLMTRVHLLNDGFIMRLASGTSSPTSSSPTPATSNYCHRKVVLQYMLHSSPGMCQEMNAHIKSVPILDIIDMMKGKYVPEKVVACLPVRERERGQTFEKINDHNNQAYVDCVAGYALSKLVERDLCPGFPRFFGHFTGIVPELKVDITEDFYHIRNQAWFHRGLGDIFTIESEDNQDNFGQSDDKTGRQIRKITIMDEEFGFTSEMKSIAEDPDIIRQEWEESGCGSKDIFDIVEIGSIKKGSGSGLGQDITESNQIILNTEEDGENTSISIEENDNDSDTRSSEGVHTECTDDDLIHDADSDADADNSEKGGSESNCDESASDTEDSYNSHDEEDEDDTSFYAILKNVPVQSTIYEDLCGSIDDLIMKGQVSDEEWLAILFQIVFSLAVAQKEYGFIHNDLHTNNVMWSKTDEQYFYYNVNGTNYKVPTFGKVIKIIDYGRSYIRFQGKEYFSDAFHQKGDAAGQYNYPPYFNNTETVVSPNKSFDLPRLACAMYESMYDSESTEDTLLRNILYQWLIDNRGKNILWNRDGIERFAGFGLYKHIARHCSQAIPEIQLEGEAFLRFRTTSAEGGRRVYVYKSRIETD